jgi:hypothetical protein
LRLQEGKKLTPKGYKEKYGSFISAHTWAERQLIYSMALKSIDKQGKYLNSFVHVCVLQLNLSTDLSALTELRVPD